MSNGVTLLKRLYISLTIAPKRSECENNLWPGNLFTVLNLTFDPCFKVRWGVIIPKRSIPPLLLVLGLQNVKTAHEKSWPANVLLVVNFGLILKNKMAVIANYLEVIKML